jgi:hypothetical protein
LNGQQRHRTGVDVQHIGSDGAEDDGDQRRYGQVAADGRNYPLDGVGVGAAEAGRASYQRAEELDEYAGDEAAEEGVAEHLCLAGVGAQVAGVIRAVG